MIYKKIQKGARLTSNEVFNNLQINKFYETGGSGLFQF